VTIGLAVAALALAVQPPSFPEPVIAPELRATNCAVAEERTRLLEQGETALEALQPLVEASGRMEARMTGHADRLIARGVWVEADRARFGRQLLASPAFVAHGSKVMAMVAAMMESIEALGAVPQDEERSCRAVLSILGQVDSSVKLGEEGWNLIDRAYAEEARRLGVSLD
jgi:hypothetical protein